MKSYKTTQIEILSTAVQRAYPRLWPVIMYKVSTYATKCEIDLCIEPIEKFQSPQGILLGAFSWYQTKEGPIYWERVFNRINKMNPIK